MNIILTIVVTCSLILTIQHSILAQAKSKMQETKEIKPLKGDQTERKIKTKDDMKSEGAQIPGIER
jgi:hypothetical protein